MKIVMSIGKGEGPTPISAFDAALLDAGISNYNLLCLSSVIPPNAVIEKQRFVSPPDEYGHRLYVVMAREEQREPGKSAYAGLGWTQEAKTGKGLFVELHGTDRADVEYRIQASLEAMIASRPEYHYGPIHAEIAGIDCHDRPVCVIVVAVYESQGWGQ